MKNFETTKAVLRPDFGVPSVGAAGTQGGFDPIRGTAMPATGFRRTAAPLAAATDAPLRTWSPLIT